MVAARLSHVDEEELVTADIASPMPERELHGLGADLLLREPLAPLGLLTGSITIPHRAYVL